MKRSASDNLISKSIGITCAVSLFVTSCSTQPLRSSYQGLHPKNRMTITFGTYAQSVGKEELLHTNKFRANEPLCLVYAPPSHTPSDLVDKLHFRIVRDDPYDVFGYEGDEVIIAPHNLVASTNVSGKTIYSYTFERAGFLSQEYLGPANQYRCTAEYWRAKDPQKFRLRELLYMVPGVNLAYMFFADYYRNDTRAPLISEHQTIKIVD